MHEFFNTFIRIYLTPWSVIEKLAYQTISVKYLQERKSFLNYLDAKIEKFLNEFENFLNLQEMIKWKSFMRTHSPQIFQDFLKDYDEFLKIYPINGSHSDEPDKVEMIGNAFNLDIPNLDQWCQPQWLRTFSPKFWVYVLIIV